MYDDRTYLFLRKFEMVPREPKLAIGREKAQRAIEWLRDQPIPEEIVHFDLETVGLQAEDPMRVITNVGISCEAWLIGIDLTGLTPEEAKPVWDWLSDCKLGGFNLKFDWAWPWGSDIVPEMYGIDTSIQFRFLATEAIRGQTHKLEDAIGVVLGWPEELFQKTWLKNTLKKHELKQDDMCFLAIKEPYGYTRYCALDAEASFQLERCLGSIIDENGFRNVWDDYNKRILPHKMWRNIQSQYFGIPVDRGLCIKWVESLQKEMLKIEGELMEHPEIKPFVEEHKERRIAKDFHLRVKEKRHKARKSDKPWMYPDKYRFQPYGDEPPKNASSWTKEFGGYFYESEAILTVSGKNNPYPRFNFNSTDDMKWLIYEKWLGEDNYEIKYFKDFPTHVDVHIKGKKYEVDLTQSKGLPTSGDILTLFGEVGKRINQYKKLDKINRDFLLKYYNDSERDGRIHPTLKIHGADTSRCTGG